MTILSTFKQENVTLQYSPMRSKYVPSLAELIIIIIIMANISLGTIIGNTVVIITLTIVDKLKRAAPNLLLLNLATSDLLEGLIFMPIMIYLEV